MALHQFPDASTPEQPPITGYRKLTPEDVSVINDIKSYEEDIARMLRLVQRHIEASSGWPAGHQLATDHPNHERNRQLSVARTEFEGAFMRLCRAVAAPESPWVRPAPTIPAPALTPDTTSALRYTPESYARRAEEDSFLLKITARANRRDPITPEEMDRLKSMAKWADNATPPNWDGGYDHMEVLRAVSDARAELEKRDRASVP